eukprot:CAMPEP_0170480898 /NCGR_PEP_ID=MMETSP0208-20121228/1552_1 /TAXON_ID=197538 /ORGANISM="Strombidium inclinatum, Strain S3" /LENGTH=335 /DNA_ID=CAMNT_0010753513 /DNA_START=21 /DNA_END=1028 /DNA_ORIENTATION=-
MKLAILALLGVTAASLPHVEMESALELQQHTEEDLEILPTWAKVESQQCKRKVVHQTQRLGQAIQGMGSDNGGASDSAKLAIARYFLAMKNQCRESPKGFYCSNKAVKDLTVKHRQMVIALKKCTSGACSNVINHLKSWHEAMDDCTYKMNSDYKVLIKIQLPPAGQKAVKKEWLDVEIEMRKFAQSPYAHDIKKNLHEWVQSDEYSSLNQTLHDFGKTELAHDIGEELEEAFDELDDATHDIDNGVEIDNDKIDDINKEFDEAGKELEKLKGTSWDHKLDEAFKNAFTEEHMKKVGEDLEAWGKTQNAKDLDKELKDVNKALKEHLKVTDVPQH